MKLLLKYGPAILRGLLGSGGWFAAASAALSLVNELVEMAHDRQLMDAGKAEALAEKMIANKKALAISIGVTEEVSHLTEEEIDKDLEEFFKNG